MNKLSKYMYRVGIGIIVLSIIRWFFMWYDPSQAILGIAIGVIVLGFADIYNERKVVQYRLDGLEEGKDIREILDSQDKRIDAIVKFYTKEEFK